MNGRNVLIGALQMLRARGAHHDSAEGQADMQHALLVVDAYCNEQKQAAVSAERERCAQWLEAMAARSPDGDTDRDALLAAADELRRA